MDKNMRLPGRDPDSARRGDPAFFVDILFRELWTLFKLNLLFVLTCIPIFTIGPALAALGHMTAEMVRDHPLDQPVREYLHRFKACFRRCVGLGLLGLAMTVVLAVALLFYWDLAGTSWLYLPLMALSMLGLLCLWGVLIHFFPALAEADEPGMVLLRRAADAALARMGKTLLALVIMAVMVLAQLLFFPMSVPITLILGCALPALVGAFAWVDRKRRADKKED